MDYENPKNENKDLSKEDPTDEDSKKEDPTNGDSKKEDPDKQLSLLHPEFVHLKTLSEKLQTLCEKQKEYIRDLEEENFMSKIQLGCMLLLTCMFILNYKA